MVDMMQANFIGKTAYRKHYVLLIVMLSLILDSGRLSAAGPGIDSLVSEGNRHYMNREYKEATDCYSKVISEGYESADLYYNLGNSCYKQNNYSKAILYYEKALLLRPDDDDARQNLALANARIVDKIDTIPEFFLSRWIHYVQGLFSPDAWAVISMVLFTLALAAFLWFVITPRYELKRLSFTAGVLLLLLSVAGLLSMRSRGKDIMKSNAAIIMVSSVNARSSPDEQSTNIFVLHEGTKVIMIDSVQDWKEIRIPDGNRGWVPETALEEI